jgi:hypothetical protein
MAKLFYRYKLILELVEVLSNVLQQSNALAITLSCNTLYVFRVDTQSRGCCFHTLSIALIGLWLTLKFYYPNFQVKLNKKVLVYLG